MSEWPAAETSTAEYDYAQPLRTLHDTMQCTFLSATDPEASIIRQRTMLRAAIAEGHKTDLDAYGHSVLDHYETVVGTTCGLADIKMSRQPLSDTIP